MTVFQAVLLALTAAIVTSSPLNGGMFNQIHSRPLIAAFFCGLIMGNMPMAMAIGIPIQAMFLGAMAIGGVSTMPSCSWSLYFIIPICIASGMDVEYAVSLAVPFGIVEQFLIQIRMQLNMIPVGIIQRSLENKNVNTALKGIYLGWVFQFVMTFAIVILGCLVGQDVLIAVVNNMPTWLTGVLGVFSSILPLVGFSLLLMSLVSSPTQLIYVLFGFMTVKVLGLSIISLTIAAVFIALLYFELSGKKSADEENDEEEEDF